MSLRAWALNTSNPVRGGPTGYAGWALRLQFLIWWAARCSVRAPSSCRTRCLLVLLLALLMKEPVMLVSGRESCQQPTLLWRKNSADRALFGTGRARSTPALPSCWPHRPRPRGFQPATALRMPRRRWRTLRPVTRPAKSSSASEGQADPTCRQRQPHSRREPGGASSDQPVRAVRGVPRAGEQSTSNAPAEGAGGPAPRRCGSRKPGWRRRG